MKAIKAACLMLAALAILAVPAAQAHSTIVPNGSAHDTSAPPIPPPWK
jgi:hypothetical protein